VFDLDGTLVDTLEPTFRCFQEAVTPALGRVPSRAEILQRFGPADHDIVSAWVGPEEAQAAVERLYRGYEHAFHDAGPFPGMVELVQELRRRGKRTAIFTGRGRRSTDVLLRSMALDGLFDVVVCGDEVAFPKPAPDGLFKILEILGVTALDAVFLGDTVKDLEAARGAGIPAIAALWASPEREALAGWGVAAAETVAEVAGLLLPPNS
jgi:HAD superfamily hydrolase (TIGR01509 family)